MVMAFSYYLSWAPFNIKEHLDSHNKIHSTTVVSMTNYRLMVDFILAPCLESSSSRVCYHKHLSALEAVEESEISNPHHTPVLAVMAPSLDHYTEAAAAAV
jgi:hypothetical protein